MDVADGQSVSCELPVAASRVNVAAPVVVFIAAPLEQVTETLEIALDTLVVEAGRRATGFDQAIGVRRMPTVTRVPVLVQGFERDGAVDSHAARATPGDALIPNLLDDLGLPLSPLAGEIRHP